jgi:hypothetical protein
MPHDFTPSERSRVKRSHLRGAYDRETVYGILDAGLLCHVGYVIDGQPYVTPTCYWREGDKLYWHGSSASRMLRTLDTGVPVCLTVSMLDGLVLARSGFHSSINYRSVMAYGTAKAITDAEEKLAALVAFSERLTPGRWDELREANEQELKATTVVAMTIDEASAKIRTGGPNDDEEDYALDIWAGVVPVTTTIGEAIPDEKLRPGIPMPGHVGQFRLD